MKKNYTLHKLLSLTLMYPWLVFLLPAAVVVAP